MNEVRQGLRYSPKTAGYMSRATPAPKTTIIPKESIDSCQCLRSTFPGSTLSKISMANLIWNEKKRYISPYRLDNVKFKSLGCIASVHHVSIQMSGGSCHGWRIHCLVCMRLAGDLPNVQELPPLDRRHKKQCRRHPRLYAAATTSRVSPQNYLSDSAELHERRAFVDLSDFRVAEVLLGGIILGKAIATVNLEAF